MINGVINQVNENNFEYNFKYTPIIGSIISDENLNIVCFHCDMQNGKYKEIRMNTI